MAKGHQEGSGERTESMRKQRLARVIACPHCYGDLVMHEKNYSCLACNTHAPIQNGVARFGGYELEHTLDSEFQAEQMHSSTATAKLYNLGKIIVSSDYKPKNQLREFLQNLSHDSVTVELGSGNRRLREDIINVDIFPFPNVDLTADILKTPFKSSSLDFVILDSVLEHVPEPSNVIKEVHRVVKPGGQVLCITPFIFPYHGYPKHYCNFSKDGLEYLFKDFTNCQVEMNIGPTSALVHLISEYFAVALAGERKLLYTVVKGAGLLPIFALKYLDRFWNPAGKATRISSILCARAVK